MRDIAYMWYEHLACASGPSPSLGCHNGNRNGRVQDPRLPSKTDIERQHLFENLEMLDRNCGGCGRCCSTTLSSMHMMLQAMLASGAGGNYDNHTTECCCCIGSSSSSTTGGGSGTAAAAVGTGE